MKRMTLKRAKSTPAAPQVDVKTRAAVPTTPAPPTHKQIQARAYELFEVRQRAGRSGNAVLDWFEAERELSAQRVPASRGT